MVCSLSAPICMGPRHMRYLIVTIAVVVRRITKFSNMPPAHCTCLAMTLSRCVLYPMWHSARRGGYDACTMPQIACMMQPIASGYTRYRVLRLSLWR